MSMSMSEIEIGDLPDSILEYVSMFILSLSELACLASTCIRMHTLLTPILHMRFSDVRKTVLHFLQRDTRKILKMQTPLCSPIIHVRYYPIGSTTLCMTYTNLVGFQYHLWNTSQKTYVTVRSLEDPAMQTFTGLIHRSTNLYPITVRLTGAMDRSTWVYPKGLFRVVRSRGRDRG